MPNKNSSFLILTIYKLRKVWYNVFRNKKYLGEWKHETN